MCVDIMKLSIQLTVSRTAIDPTRLNKGRKFAPTTSSHSRNPDTSLWTETPAEKQQRIADELSGKKRRKENSDTVDDNDGRVELEARKKRKRDEEIHRAVSEHTVHHFPPPTFPLVDAN
jgi:Protein of unknown function (DUF3752)